MTNPTPAQASVEAVARIIDPKSWEAYDHAYSMQIGEFRRFADRVVKPSLATASEVLAALSPPPTVGAEEEAGWQDISTAPKEPWSKFLIWATFIAGAEVRLVTRDHLGRMMALGCSQEGTHWKPLPEPPVSCIASEKGE